MAELREGAGRAGFLTVRANTSHIWVSLRQTKSGSRAVATASIGMAHHGTWLPAAAAGRWTSGEPGGASAVGGTWRSAGWRVGFSLPSPDSPQTGSVVCFILGVCLQDESLLRAGLRLSSLILQHPLARHF